MDRILNAIKCTVCREILESPVILPCSCNICNKHVSNQAKDTIRCFKCGIEHKIPNNGFQENKVLQEIIDTDIAKLDFGSVHKEAKKSCESVENALKEFEVLIKDPYAYTYQVINDLKFIVQQKGEELKLIIDQEMKKLIVQLENYQRQSKEYLSSVEFRIQSNKLKNDFKLPQSNLDLWLESLNK